MLTAAIWVQGLACCARISCVCAMNALITLQHVVGPLIRAGRLTIEELIAGLQYVVDSLEEEIARRELAEGQDDNEESSSEGADHFA